MSRGLRLSNISEVVSSVVITLVDSDASSGDTNVDSDREVFWKERQTRAVLLQNHLSLEEDSLRGSSVHLLGLIEHDGVVLEVVVDNKVSNSEVLKSALHDALLEVSVETQDLLVKLDESGLKLLSNVSSCTEMVLEHGLREGLAGISLLWNARGNWRSRERVEGNLHVLGVGDLLQLVVRDTLVTGHGRVMGGHEAWKFGEVGCHFFLNDANKAEITIIFN